MLNTRIKSLIKKLEAKYGMKNNENPDLDYVLKLVDIDNNDRKDDTQRRMAWFALLGMLLYPALVMLTDYLNLDKASDLIANMASIYFVSVSAIVMVFYGANAYAKTKSDNIDK